jgi:hypothetical protein
MAFIDVVSRASGASKHCSCSELLSGWFNSFATLMTFQIICTIMVHAVREIRWPFWFKVRGGQGGCIVTQGWRRSTSNVRRLHLLEEMC